VFEQVKTCGAKVAESSRFLYSVISHIKRGTSMIIEFQQIRSLIPGYIFNEFGQLSGHFVRADEIVCESDNGRIRIWLNRDAFEARDPELLICDYSEADLHFNG
jgi:hypothetical protein